MKVSWSDQVHCSDSSSTGFAVCATKLDAILVATIGRADECWRFRAEDYVNSRARALRPDVLALDVEMLSRDRTYSAADDNRPWEEELLAEVPAATIAAIDWSTCLSRTWKSDIQILRSEGKALFMSARHALRSSSNHCKHLLLLSDSVPLVLAATKGRANSHWLLRSCRELCALSLFSQARFHVR